MSHVVINLTETSGCLMLMFVSGLGGVRVPVRVGSDFLCHLPQPKAGDHWRHQHCHLCLGDWNVQRESQVALPQTGTCADTPCTAVNTQHFCVNGTLFKAVYSVKILAVVKPFCFPIVFLLQALLGHTDAVTCLTASSAYHIVVSGSRDRTCIIWDLNKLSFVTQLRGHRAPISALCINELTVRWSHNYFNYWETNGMIWRCRLFKFKV